MTMHNDRPEVHSYDSLTQLATSRTLDEKPRAALVVPSETDTLPAFLDTFGEGRIDPTIIGDEQRLEQDAELSGYELSPIKLIDINQPAMALRAAAKMAVAGDIDMIVQGRVGIGELRTILSDPKLEFVAPDRVLSHVGVLKPVKYSRLLMITDGLVHDQPDLNTKIGLLQNLSRVCAAIGVPNPRTAVVTAVEAIYPQMPATLDGAVLAKMSSRGQLEGVRVDGPLSFDIAIDPEAAEAKGITDSEVAGRADAMLASTKQVAQGIYQAMSLFGECDLGGVLVGGKVPVAVNFATDSEDARYNSILLATLLAAA
jgi:phosphotransacetylase